MKGTDISTSPNSEFGGFLKLTFGPGGRGYVISSFACIICGQSFEPNGFLLEQGVAGQEKQAALKHSELPTIPEHPHTEVTTEAARARSDGKISNRPGTATELANTPVARYRKQVSDGVGSRWYYYIRPQMDAVAEGSARISFRVDEQGRACDIKVLANSSNAAFRDVCVQAVSKAELLPPPSDVLATTKDNRFETELTFTWRNK